MKYRSKIGPLWITTLIIFGALQISLFRDTFNHTAFIFVLVIFLGCDFFFLDVTVRSYYTLHVDYLEIRFGVFTHLKIPYNEIYSLRETKNPLSSAGLSIDRIDIIFKSQTGNGEGEILISPVRKLEFIQQLLLKGKSIKVK